MTLNSVLFAAILSSGTSLAAAQDVDSSSEDEKSKSALQSTPDDHSVTELNDFIVTNMPVVARFQAALADGDRNVILGFIIGDFHVLSRSNYEKKLSLDALLEYTKDCEVWDRMSANIASIEIEYICPKNQIRRVLYNFDSGRVSRILIGDIPPMTVAH